MTPDVAEFRHEPDRRTLVVAGDLDGDGTQRLSHELAEHVLGGEAQRIDLSGVTFLPSTAIGVLARAHSEVLDAGRPLDLVAAPGSIAARILSIVALPVRSP